MNGAPWLHKVVSVFKAAAGGLRHGAGMHSLAVGIIALSLTALGAFGLLVTHVSDLAASWGRDLTVTVFLKPDVGAEDVARIQLEARRMNGVLEARHVTRAAARERLEKALGERASILEGAPERVIPEAVEVELIPGTPPETGSALAATFRQDAAVEDVAWGAEELSRLGAVVSILRVAGWLLGILIALVAVLIISNTLKLTVLARKDEIEIMTLVGGSDLFVRAPFLIEGAAQGWMGGMVAGGCLLALHQAVAFELEHALAEAFGPILLGGPPWMAAGLLVVAGTGLGIVGGVVGVGRFLKVA